MENENQLVLMKVNILYLVLSKVYRSKHKFIKL